MPQPAGCEKLPDFYGTISDWDIQYIPVADPVRVHCIVSGIAAARTFYIENRNNKSLMQKPGLSQQNAFALLLELNQDIEEYADATVTNVIEKKNFDLTYPPNNGLTEAERKEIEKLDNNEALKNALRKIIADNTAGVIFNLLNLLDGTGAPKIGFDEWTGVMLVDEDERGTGASFDDTLHDAFFETYWEWKRLRAKKPWKLDTLDE